MLGDNWYYQCYHNLIWCRSSLESIMMVMCNQRRFFSCGRGVFCWRGGIFFPRIITVTIIDGIIEKWRIHHFIFLLNIHISNVLISCMTLELQMSWCFQFHLFRHSWIWKHCDTQCKFAMSFMLLGICKPTLVCKNRIHLG